MKLNQFSETYWDYYLILESDFLQTQRYVTINTDNFNTFSVEYAKQYQTICSEIDVICKEYCDLLDNANRARNIYGYASIILDMRSDIKKGVVKVKNASSVKLNPWDEWNTDLSSPLDGNNPNNVSPTWWTFYNKVKHNRTKMDSNNKEFFKHANLINTLNALAGLFVLEMYCYKDLALAEDERNITIPNKPSKLFDFEGWEKHFILLRKDIGFNTAKNQLIFND